MKEQILKLVDKLKTKPSCIEQKVYGLERGQPASSYRITYSYKGTVKDFGVWLCGIIAELAAIQIVVEQVEKATLYPYYDSGANDLNAEVKGHAVLKIKTLSMIEQEEEEREEWARAAVHAIVNERAPNRTSTGEVRL